LYAEASPEHPPPALPAATTLSTDAMAAVLKERREQLEPLWHPEVLNESVLGAAASIVPTHPGTGAGAKRGERVGGAGQLHPFVLDARCPSLSSSQALLATNCTRLSWMHGARFSTDASCTPGVPLRFTLLFLLKRCRACDQWHSSRAFTSLTGSLLLPVHSVHRVRTLQANNNTTTTIATTTCTE
jgi:hypothetical protein